MAKSALIGKIISRNWEWISGRYNSHILRNLDAIQRCRTASLGGHVYACNKCGGRHIRYNSCRNRHCPRCQHTQKERWIASRMSELIDCKYYHVVFTLPNELNELTMAYPRQLYSLLFKCAWKTLEQFGWNGKYVGGQIGATMVLHSWGSTMSYHPHLHCIVPGGGIDLKGKWKQAKGKGKFLFPVKALSKVFRGKYVEGLESFMESEGMELPLDFKSKLYKKDWVVYCKPPFGGPKVMVQYLARYTHSIAISHHRIKGYSSDNKLRISYKDYRHANQQKELHLSVQEFIRRFAMHILPHGFTRIRHYGLMSSRWKTKINPEKKKPKLEWQSLWKAKGLEVDS